MDGIHINLLLIVIYVKPPHPEFSFEIQKPDLMSADFFFAFSRLSGFYDWLNVINI